MALAIYGLNEGQTEQDVTYSATSLSTDIKIQVDLSKFPTTGSGAKSEILKNLKILENYILKDQDSIFG